MFVSKKTNNHGREKGFTLVELVLAMAIFSFVLVIIISSITGLYRIYRSGVGIRDTQQQARVISEDITRATRDASHIVVGTNAVCLFYPASQVGNDIITDSQIFAAVNVGTRDSWIIHRRMPIANLNPATPPTCVLASYPAAGERRLTNNEVSVMLFNTSSATTAAPTAIQLNTVLNFDVRLASRRADFATELVVSAYDPLQPYTTGPRCVDGVSFCSMTSISSTAQARSQLVGGSE